MTTGISNKDIQSYRSLKSLGAGHNWVAQASPHSSFGVCLFWVYTGKDFIPGRAVQISIHRLGRIECDFMILFKMLP